MKLLLKETHHRITNNLIVLRTIIDMQANKTENREARDVLKLAACRMDSLTLIHKKLYTAPPDGMVDTAAYIEELVGNISQAFQGMTVELEVLFNIEQIELPWRHAAILGLIVNELVTNSIKHAFPGKDCGSIQVTLKRKDDLIELSVTDDGVGLSRSIDLMKLDSLGMTIVRALTSQVKGNLSIRQSNGFSACVSFPDMLKNKAM